MVVERLSLLVQLFHIGGNTKDAFLSEHKNSIYTCSNINYDTINGSTRVSEMVFRQVD